MAQRPRGTVTFLFTDVEGSTHLLKQLRDSYGGVLEDAPAAPPRGLGGAHGGEEVDTQGDAFFYVFSRARDAAAAAADGQRALAAHDWPEGAELRVCMGLHTGEPVLSDEGRYHGMRVYWTARIMAAGHGGQILASQSTASSSRTTISTASRCAISASTTSRISRVRSGSTSYRWTACSRTLRR